MFMHKYTSMVLEFFISFFQPGVEQPAAAHLWGESPASHPKAELHDSVLVTEEVPAPSPVIMIIQKPVCVDLNFVK